MGVRFPKRLGKEGMTAKGVWERGESGGQERVSTKLGFLKRGERIRSIIAQDKRL